LVESLNAKGQKVCKSKEPPETRRKGRQKGGLTPK